MFARWRMTLAQLALLGLLLPTLALPVPSWHHHASAPACAAHHCHGPEHPTPPSQPVRQDDERCPVCAIALLLVPELPPPAAAIAVAATLDLPCDPRPAGAVATPRTALARGPPA